MVSTVKWGEIKSKGGGGDRKSGDLFLSLGEGQTKLRAVGSEPVTFNMVWVRGKRYILPDAYVSRFKALGILPRTMYAINVIDREDTKNGITRFKILEKGPTVFAAFAGYKSATGNDPGGVKGPDFCVEGTIPPGKKARDVQYTVMPIGEAPFTKAEMDLIRRPQLVKEGKYDEETWKKLPLGEKGPIDLHRFYDEEKWIEKVVELLNAAAGLDEDLSGEDSDTVENAATKLGGEASSLEDVIQSSKKAESPPEVEKTSVPASSPTEDVSEEDFENLLKNAF